MTDGVTECPVNGNTTGRVRKPTPCTYTVTMNSMSHTLWC